MNNIYNRRQVIKKGISGLVAFSALGLSACNDTPPSSSVQGPVAMHMLFWGSATRDKLTKQAINLFHKRYPDVTITSEYTAFNGYWSKLDVLTAAGNTPELFQMDMRYLAKYVRSRLMLDLTPLIYNQTINLSDFDPIMLDGSKANNTIYGVPLGGNYQCLIYDTELLDRSKVGPPPGNMTWEVFAEYVGNIRKALGGNVYGSGDSSGDLAVYEIWVRQRGKELYTVDGKLAFDEQDVADWFNYWSQLRDAGACVPADLQEKFANASGPANTSLIHGNSVFVMPHTNEFESYQALTKHKLALYPIPNGPGPGLYYKPSLLISISSKSRHVEEAANFIDFIVNDPDGIKAIGVERGVPGTLKAQGLLSPSFTAAQQLVFAFVDGISKSGNTRIKEVLDPPAASQVATLFTQASVAVSFKRSSIANAAQTFYAAAQKVLG